MDRRVTGGRGGLKKSTHIVPCFLFVELVIMSAVVLLAYYFEYTDTFPVHLRGFFCFDRTFSRPYLGPEESSRAPPALVYSLVTAIPTITILIGELAAFFSKPESPQEKTIVTADCCYFSPMLRRIVRFLGIYSFGLFVTTIFANAGQVVTGSQTPHFLSVCRPNYTALGCRSPLQYISEKRACRGNPSIINSARKSFPSKDTALSTYCAVYTAMYITLACKTKGTRLATPTLSLAVISLAVMVGVVRVAEYRNHWSDILAGFVTGGAIAMFLVTCVINNFQQKLPPASLPVLPPPPPPPPPPPSELPPITMPSVESPLEKFQALRSQVSHDDQRYLLSAPPDVLVQSRRPLTSAV
ncbi:phospholipid phosphatase-related protein type 2 isoform X1 [Ictalurus punctatus]|uniref:Phospholipid phosphatase-related protein type 5 n=1 Tax=Ictalurus punctatus TaxID=7998 RepID=A0A2D0S205_ICTPU|nr:phospholipid phosphatase-related protein type 2 isoform X1 [Ictalurus punctatus]